MSKFSFFAVGWFFLLVESQWQISTFDKKDNICPYSIAMHSAIYYDSTSVYIFPGKDTDNGKLLSQCLIMNPTNLVFSYSANFVPDDVSASQLTNSVCAIDDTNIAIWWGKKASNFNVVSLESTKLGSPVNNGYPSTMACYKENKQLWIMQKDAYKVFTYKYSSNSWTTQSIINTYDHQYSPSIFYNSTLVCAGGETNAKIEYVDVNNYVGWSVANNEIGLGNYGYYYGATHALVDYQWYLLGGETAKNTLTSDIWIINMNYLVNGNTNFLTKSTVSLTVPLYFTAAVYDEDSHKIFVIGGATNTNNDGSQSIDISNFFTNTPTTAPTGKTIVPTAKSMAPTTKTVAPTGKTTAPTGKTVRPTQSPIKRTTRQPTINRVSPSTVPSKSPTKFPSNFPTKIAAKSQSNDKKKSDLETILKYWYAIVVLVAIALGMILCYCYKKSKKQRGLLSNVNRKRYGSDYEMIRS